MTQAPIFLNQFRNAATTAEQRQIANAYLRYFDGLSATEQQQARQVMQPLRTDIQQSLDELDQLSKELHRILSVKVS